MNPFFTVLFLPPEGAITLHHVCKWLGNLTYKKHGEAGWLRHVGFGGSFSILFIHVLYSFEEKPRLGLIAVVSWMSLECCPCPCCDTLSHLVCVVLQEALKVMEFTEEEIRDVFKLLSAVLQMGNIEFMTAGGAQITSKGGRRRNAYRTEKRSQSLPHFYNF